MTSSKTCSRCKASKPTADFARCRSAHDGLQFTCRECQKAVYHERREANLAKQAEYRLANTTSKAKYNRDYYLQNAERIGNQVREYRRRKPEVYKATANRRRVRKAANGILLVTKKETQRLYAQRCFYCGSTDYITLDHVIPIQRGGRHSIGNLIPACRACNSSKKNQFITEWKIARSRREAA